MKRGRIILVLFLALLLLAAGSFVGLQQYRSWQQRSLVQKARAFLASADYRNASLCARQAVQSNPENVDASRVLAELAEMARGTNAIVWRKRVVELEPHAASNRLALARTALSLSQLETAREALAQLDDATRQTAEYHKLQAKIDWTGGRLGDAETHFMEASRLEPTNVVSVVDLNLVRLPSTNLGVAAIARVTLQSLATNETLRPEILRQLSADALRRGRKDEAIRRSQELIDGSPNLSDQLRHIGLLLDSQSMHIQGYLFTLQRQVATNALHVAALGRWMVVAKLGADCVRWVDSLPEPIRVQQPVVLMQAEAMVAAKDWSRLGRHVGKGTWDDDEFLRHLLLARVAREERNNSGERSHWLKALKAASSSTERLLQVIKNTESWGWRDEMDEALGAVMEQFPEQRWAEDYLTRSLKMSGKTQALQNLLTRTVEREPTNHLAKSSLATMGMLLDPTDRQPYKLSAEAFEALGTNASVAAAYALSLHLQRQTDQALQIMEQIPAERLEAPPIAARYGFLLTEAGQRERARKYLKLAEKARLLPEEKRMLAKARGEG